MTTLLRLPVAKPLPLALLIAALFPASSFAQTEVEAQMSTIEVVGRNESGAYHAEEAAGAKTDLPLRELPQSVRTVTRQAIDDLGATKLDDVLDYVGGVSRQNNFGGLWDNVSIRGLPGNENTGIATLYNGFSSGRGFNAPRDLAGIERIEFLKGTAAALYGSSEPGGTLNIVSKRPLWKSAHSAEAYLGSYGLKRGTVDSTGPLSDTFAYRLNIAVEDKGSFRDHVDSNRQVFAPAFTWKINRDTLLEYVGEILRHATNLDRGVVAVNDQLGVIPASRFLGEPADGRVTVKNQTHQFMLSHDINTDWRTRVGLSYRETSINGYSTEASGLQADGTLNRQRRYRDYQSDDIALQAELIGKLTTGSIAHDLLVGVETYRFNMDTLALRAPAAGYSINIYNPVYGQTSAALAPQADTRDEQRNTAVYLQDAITLAEQWRLIAGVRVDRYKQSLINHRTNVTTTQEPSATSPRIGVSWLPTSQWTVYANAGTSFRPNVGADAASQGFDPEKGRALELGTKWESADQQMGVTAALFDIRKKNVLTADPNNSGFSVAAGEIRSRGLEMDFAGQVSRHWRMNASFVYNKVDITKDNNFVVGSRVLNVPKVTGSVLAVYENALANGQRYGIGGGATYVGERLGQAYTQTDANNGIGEFNLPSYTTAKLVGYWRLSPTLSFTLDIDNVFNTTYYTSSYSRLWVAPGTSRTATLGLQAKF